MRLTLSGPLPFAQAQQSTDHVAHSQRVTSAWPWQTLLLCLTPDLVSSSIRHSLPPTLSIFFFMCTVHVCHACFVIFVAVVLCVSVYMFVCDSQSTRTWHLQGLTTISNWCSAPFGGSKERNTPLFWLQLDANRDGLDYREGMTWSTGIIHTTWRAGPYAAACNPCL